MTSATLTLRSQVDDLMAASKYKPLWDDSNQTLLRQIKVTIDVAKFAETYHCGNSATSYLASVCVGGLSDFAQSEKARIDLGNQSPNQEKQTELLGLLSKTIDQLHDRIIEKQHSPRASLSGRTVSFG